jgi:D-alanine-D-alanine ligase
MTKKLTVAILYGGRSVEHEISIRSASNVVANIDRNLYNIFLLGIDKHGTWFLTDSVTENISSGRAVAIRLDASDPKIMLPDSSELIDVDIAFPVLHGTDGEDGSIQGLFKAMDIPVLGSGVLGSAVSMDKIVSKKILKECGVPVAGYLEFNKAEKSTIDFDKIVDAIGLPFMIKSASLGSSVGVSMVKEREDFANALAESFRYDDQVIVEQFVRGRELECAVIGNKKLKASFPGEIIMVKDYDFYNYTAKYLDQDAIKISLPAELDEATTARIRQVSMDAYKALRCEDFARVDIFLTDDGEVLVNEINTIPGFTSASMFPMMWQHMGMTYPELITELISMCLIRHEEAKNHETSYKVVN